MSAKEATLKAPEKRSTPTYDDRTIEIYEQAAEIITRKGYDATSMNDIARAVDLTKAGLYYYIRGKKELLYAVMNFGLDAIDRVVVEPVETIADPEERLQEIIARHARMLTEYSGAITILFEETRSLTPDHRRIILERNRIYFDFVRNTLQELQNEGRLRELDVTIATSNLFSVILRVARWYRSDGRLKSENVVDEVLKFALNGLLKSPSNGK